MYACAYTHCLGVRSINSNCQENQNIKGSNGWCLRDRLRSSVIEDQSRAADPHRKDPVEVVCVSDQDASWASEYFVNSR